MQDDLARHVTEITRASGTSFYGAMRILPKNRREGMYALYAFCRVVDDIADDPGDIDRKRLDLQSWRDEINAVYDRARTPVLPVAKALESPVQEFGLSRDDFLEIIAGMEMDGGKQVRIPDMKTLYLYCDRVACAVGRQSNRIFGIDKDLVEPIARHTGMALQLTNILRDIAEDVRINRLYLPEDRLKTHGLDNTQDLSVVLDHPATRRVCAELAALAAKELEQADIWQAKAPRRAIRPAVIMKEVYRRYLGALIRRGWDRLDQPVHVSRITKIFLALRYGLF